ncbi:hypothetical protein SAMN04489860_0588 [Paraoerskovia marina]|uniref:Uncharacterized protein n=1 Tax=Paraoerskovia marina TaxID=545619 RepID=A0A1H1NQB5_9CELL|nr:hypothetical protein [Paraoerskovia marina]SDS00915.1 hypothetical protein SAMN04489860_0588 [Paraoerskovia marina]
MNIEWSALGSVIIWGILIGAGLPALFALGVKTLAVPAGPDGERHPSLGRRVGAWTCFGVIILAIVGAVVFIASGGH